MTVLSSLPYPRRVRRRHLRAAGIGAIVVVVAAGTAAQLLNYGLHLDSSTLDSSDDGGAFGVVGDVALATAALAAWRMRRRLRGWGPACAALPVLLTFLTLDKVLRLHDHIAAWRLYYAPVLLVVVVGLVTAARHLPPPTARLIHVGLVLLIVGFGVHVAGHAVLDRLGFTEDSWAEQIKAVTKHGAEVAGWLLVALALALGRFELDDGGKDTRRRAVS
jgi:hypothetical protein